MIVKSALSRLLAPESTRVVQDNIRTVWLQRDAIDYEEGMMAYWKLNQSLRALGLQYMMPLPRVVGAFSALSPNNDYLGNMRSVITLLHGHMTGVPLDKLTVSTYNACKRRAWRCINDGEDFLSFTKGKKTRAFYQNILSPDDPEPVTIDGHMMCVAAGKRMTMREAVRLKFKYDHLACAFRDVAQEEGLLPNQLQAVLWFTWKRIHKVIYTPQLDLFRFGNQWGYGNVEHLQPFKS